MLCVKLGDEWIPGLTLKEKWALRPRTNDPSSPVKVINIADYQPSPELIAQAREKNGWRREQSQRALTWLSKHGFLPATTGYQFLSATSTFIDLTAFERTLEAEFEEQYSQASRSPHPTETEHDASTDQPAIDAAEPAAQPDAATAIESQDDDNAIGTEPDAELKKAPEAKIREAIRAEYKEAAVKKQKPPNIKELPPLVQNRLKPMGYRASQARIAKIGGEEEFDNLRLDQGHKWTGRKTD